MKKVVLVTGMIAVTATAAAADVTYYSGHECQPPDIGGITYDYRGCLNNTTSAAPYCGRHVSVSLPISGNASDTVDLNALEVFVHDPNIYSEIVCTPMIVTASGSIFVGAFRGSGDATVGHTSIAWSGSALPNAGAAITGVRSFHIGCGIPPRQSFDVDLGCNGNQQSYIKSYRVDRASP